MVVVKAMVGNVERVERIASTTEQNAINQALVNMGTNTTITQVVYVKSFNSDPGVNEENVARNIQGCPAGYVTVRWD
ncbi:MAG: hypothetical protein ACLU1V_07165 [Bacteroides fragilis]